MIKKTKQPVTLIWYVDNIIRVDIFTEHFIFLKKMDLIL